MEKVSTKTRYLTFKPDKYITHMRPHLQNVYMEIASSPSGITFDDLLMKVSYKGGFMGPRLLKASLKHLFDWDYIITNHQIAKLSKSMGIDVNKIRGFRPC